MAMSVQTVPGPKGPTGDQGVTGEQGPPYAGAWVCGDHHFLAWTFGPSLIVGASAVYNQTTFYWHRIRLGVAASVTNIYIPVSAVGSGLVTGQCFAALYDHTSRNFLRQSTDQAANWTAGGAANAVVSLSSPISLAAGDYAIAWWINGTTGPTFYRTVGVGSMNLAITEYRAAYRSQNQTTTAPASLPTTTIGATSPVFMALT